MKKDSPRAPRPGIVAAPAALTKFPIRDRYTVSGHVAGDVCFTCECRILELDGNEGMFLAWCECGWPDDAHEMEILVAGGR